MPSTQTERAPLFLSSPVEGLEDLRREIHLLGKKEGVPIYVGEIDTPIDPLTQIPLETIDDVLTQIQGSRRLICLFGPPRHGSKILLGAQQAHVSFWEMELFFAALAQIPTSIVVIDGFEPEPKLEAVLRIFRLVFPPEEWVRVPNEKAATEWLRRHMRSSTQRFPGLLAARMKRYVSRLVERLFIERRRHCLFLDGQLYDSNIEPDIHLIEGLFEEMSASKDEKQRLCRLWMIGRELMGSRIDHLDDYRFLPLWSRFFREWSTAGAWYGLHGHIHMGCVAALEGAVRVAENAKKAQDAIGGVQFPPEVLKYPGGPLATARYSTSKKMGSWRLKRRILSDALEDLQLALHQDPGNRGNLLAIRGSIYRQMFRFSSAVKDYESVLKWREEHDASDSKIGEALTELGFGYLFQGRLLKRRDVLAQGMELMESQERRTGFQVRAKKKMAAAHFATGNWKLAAQLRAEARELAEHLNIRDQM